LDYPIDLLKRAGVDMHGQGAFEETVASMSKAMDEIEMILDRLEK